MTSFSNISGAGFASAREEWAEGTMSVSQYSGLKIVKPETLPLAKSLHRYAMSPLFL